MNKRGKGLPKWLVIFVIVPFALSCHRGAKKEDIKGSIQRAVSWVCQHPASFSDGLFVEISEEIITFYIMYNHTEDPSAKSNYLKEIKKRFELIALQKDFKVNPQEYTMFLTMASIHEKLGLTFFDFRKGIEKQLISDPLLYPKHITTCIWNTVYLTRLGYQPPKALEEFLPQSTLAKELHQRLLFQYVNVRFDPRYIDLIGMTVYDLTHEIFSLTDFGQLPPPPIIAENHAFFSDLFDHGIEWAIEAEHVDVLAEMIMCVKILNLKNISSLQRGVDYIISRQEKDGSYGITNPGRQNVYRHGILVSIMALSMI